MARVHDLDGWTVLAFWEEPSGERGCLCGAVSMLGSWRATDIMEAIRDCMPDLLTKLPFPIIIENTDG